MYDHTLHRGSKHFCHYCLHAFIKKEILKRHIKNSFKINDKWRITIPKKRENVEFKHFERKINSQFMIMQLLKVFLYLDVMENKIQMSLTLTNLKNTLVLVMVIN